MTTTGKTKRVSWKKKAEELEAQLKAQQNGGQSLDGDFNNNVKIPLDDLIPVMSLLTYPLILTTREKGQGKVIKFESFGEIKRILYSDLLDILEVKRHFMENGYYYILDERVIRAHGLQEAYSKILTKDKIDSILSGTKRGLELYESCNPEQQKTIVSMITEKLVTDSNSLDLNMVDRLSRASGINITQNANDARAFLNVGAETA